MKKSISLTLILLLFSVISVSAQNWNAVNFPVEENINGISFVNLDTAFFITGTGKLIRTFDNLNTYDIFEPTPGLPLEDVEFISSDKGFICGPKGTVMITTDGGYTFKNLKLTDTTAWFFDVEMFDSNHGMVIGMTRDSANPLQGLAFRTEDGGKSWDKVENLGMGYSEIIYYNSKVYLLAFGQISISDDMGKSWESKLTLNGAPGRTLSFYGNSGIIAGIGGMCAYSKDGGNVWMPSQQDENQFFIASQMISVNSGYIGGNHAKLLKTTDGGRTWSSELMAKYFDVYDMALVENRIYVVGSQGGIIWKEAK